MNYILRILLSIRIVEEVIQCLLNSSIIYVYFRDKEGYGNVERVELEMAKVVFHMYEVVVVGRLLLKTAKQIALVDNWHD
jgi:hypothetical protein